MNNSNCIENYFPFWGFSGFSIETNAKVGKQQLNACLHTIALNRATTNPTKTMVREKFFSYMIYL